MTSGGGFVSRLKGLFGRAEPEFVVPELPLPVEEVGSFAYGVCSACDWRGPGRRARSAAVQDAELHGVVGCSRPAAADRSVREDSSAR